MHTTRLQDKERSREGIRELLIEQLFPGIRVITEGTQNPVRYC